AKRPHGGGANAVGSARDQNDPALEIRESHGRRMAVLGTRRKKFRTFSRAPGGSRSRLDRSPEERDGERIPRKYSRIEPLNHPLTRPSGTLSPARSGGEGRGEGGACSAGFSLSDLAGQAKTCTTNTEALAVVRPFHSFPPMLSLDESTVLTDEVSQARAA